MGWPVCNTTVELESIDGEASLFTEYTYTFHTLALVISAVCGLIAIVVSLFLMFMHTIHYSRPTEQKHIVRILFMVPIYSVVSYLSVYFYKHSVYYEVLRDCYEAFAIASFFSLMCAYVAPSLHDQKEYFRVARPKPWIFPITQMQRCCGGEHGWLRTPRSGLTWFNIIWVAVFQYCFFRVAMTIVAVLTQYWGRYCLESLNPAFSRIWVMVIVSVAVTIAMYCVIQFYYQLREDIAQHNPIMKVVAIKLVIFLSFWQTILISLLTSTGVMHTTEHVYTPDIKVGLPATLLCIEMAIFSILHIFSFPWTPYVIGSAAYVKAYGHLKETPKYYGGPLGIKATIDCFNPWDIVKAVGRSTRWLFVGRKHRLEDVSYQHTTAPHKLDHLHRQATTQQMSPAGAPTSVLHQEESGSRRDEGNRLRTSTNNVQNTNPYATRGGDSAADSMWQAIEARDYLQDQMMRRSESRVEEGLADALIPARRFRDPYAQSSREK